MKLHCSELFHVSPNISVHISNDYYEFSLLPYMARMPDACVKLLV